MRQSLGARLGALSPGCSRQLSLRASYAGRKVGLVLGGGNIDPMLLADIIQRGMVLAGRPARMRMCARDVHCKTR